MEIDSLLDICGESMCCIGCFLDAVLLTLGTTKGRIALFVSKAIGVYFDIAAIKSAGDITRPLLIVLIVFEKILLLILIPIYGFHPKHDYEESAIKEEYEEEEQDKDKDKEKENQEKGVVELKVNDGLDNENGDTAKKEYGQTNTNIDHDNVDSTKNGLENKNEPNNQKTMDSALSEQEYKYPKICLLFIPATSNQKLEGVRTLWYGALWATSDYIAHVYKYTSWSKIKLIFIMYIITLVFLAGILLYIMFAQLDEMQGGTNKDGDVDTIKIPCDEFPTWSDAFFFFNAIITAIFGLFQHQLVIGELFFKKRRESMISENDKEKEIPSGCNECDYDTGIKYGCKYSAYPVFGIYFGLLIYNLMDIIETIQIGCGHTPAPTRILGSDF